jgi:diaminopimelate epimerase
MQFSKWHALGNAYLLVERADGPLDAARARRLCDPRTGIGADGVLDVAADGARADVTVWNPDGSQAEFSGNGARIAAAWLAARAGTAQVVLRFGARDVTARVDGHEVELDVGPVEVGEPEELDLQFERVEFTPVSVGNPHAVVRHDVTELDLLRLGPLVEAHTRFPGRTNVQLVRVLGPRELEIAIWERGVGPTRSSGSSAVAAAAAAVANGWCESPVRVGVPAGGSLTVTLDGNRARLAGPVEEICRGAVLLPS